MSSNLLTTVPFFTIVSSFHLTAITSSQPISPPLHHHHLFSTAYSVHLTISPLPHHLHRFTTVVSVHPTTVDATYPSLFLGAALLLDNRITGSPQPEFRFARSGSFCNSETPRSLYCFYDPFIFDWIFSFAGISFQTDRSSRRFPVIVKRKAGHLMYGWDSTGFDSSWGAHFRFLIGSIVCRYALKPTCVWGNLAFVAILLMIIGGFTWIITKAGWFSMSYSSCAKSFIISLLQVDSPGPNLYPSSFSTEKKSLSSFPLSMKRDVSSDLSSSVCFSFFIGLLSCGAVSTGPEDATENILVFLGDEVWTSMSHYVTILQLFDLVVNASPTHLSIVLNSLSSSTEELSYLVCLSVVMFAYGQRGWIIPSLCCMEEV